MKTRVLERVLVNMVAALLPPAEAAALRLGSTAVVLRLVKMTGCHGNGEGAVVQVRCGELWLEVVAGLGRHRVREACAALGWACQEEGWG